MPSRQFRLICAATVMALATNVPALAKDLLPQAQATGVAIDKNGDCGATLTLNLQTDPCVTAIEPITITVDVTDLTCDIVGAQFFLDFDPSCWRVFLEQPDDGIIPGEGWMEITEDVDNDEGKVTYAVFRLDAVSGDMTLATITMVPVAESCECCMSFDTDHTPSTTLTQPGGGGVDLDLQPLDGLCVRIDFTPPECTPPDDITTNADPGMCSAMVDPGTPECTDNCDVFTCTCTDCPTNGYPVGDTVVTWICADECGNETDPMQQTITINDGEDPVITCPDDINTDNDEGMCGAVVTWDEITCADNCPGCTVTCDHSSGDFFPVGTTTVCCTAEDAAGNTAECCFDVTVNDTEDPDITCPDDISTDNDANTCGAFVTWDEITCADNCDSCTVTCDHDSGDFFPVGTTTVCCTAEDTAGNTAECCFDVTVNDVEDPVCTPPDDIVECNIPGTCFATVDIGMATCTDNCECSCDYVVAGKKVPDDLYPVGITTIVWTCTDPSGNSCTSEQTVVVLDCEDPTFDNCPADIDVPNDEGMCGAVVTWDEITCSDNCPGCTVTCDHSSGDFFPVGTTEVCCTAVDAEGNTAECCFDVTVNDTEDPTFDNCPADIDVPNDEGMCGAVVTWDEITCSDNCLDCTVTCDHSSGDFFPVGTTEVCCTAEDTAGNTAECCFDVTVNDVEDPVITCPDDIDTDNDEGMCGAVVTWDEIACADNCPGCIVTCDHSSGDFFPVGTTTVCCTAEDAAGNTAECCFDVTVNDVEDPEITCPEDITVHEDINSCGGAYVTWDEITCSDNCPGCTVTCDHDSGDFFPVDTTEVCCTAEDEAGNTAECCFDVTVLEGSEVIVNVELAGAFVTPLTRCITFELFNCDSPADFFVVEKELTFDGGGGLNPTASETLLVPCGGSYGCITARDRLHTLRRTAEIAVVENHYEATFEPLIGGNLNDNCWIDIVDAGILIGWIGEEMDPDTTCPTPDPLTEDDYHPDINGDGIVDSLDLSFIIINFLEWSDVNCCGFDSDDSPLCEQDLLLGDEGPRTEISVAELRAMGLHSATAADLTGDGMVNQEDIAAFIAGARPGDPVPADGLELGKPNGDVLPRD